MFGIETGGAGNPELAAEQRSAEFMKAVENAFDRLSPVDRQADRESTESLLKDFQDKRERMQEVLGIVQEVEEVQ